MMCSVSGNSGTCSETMSACLPMSLRSTYSRPCSSAHFLSGYGSHMMTRIPKPLKI